MSLPQPTNQIDDKYSIHQQSETKPADEIGSVSVESKIKISDPESGLVFLNQRV
jgi:hypothetical protein